MININFLLVLLPLLLLESAAPGRCSIGVSFAGPAPSRAIVLVEAAGAAARVPIPDEPLYQRAIPDSIVAATGYRFRVLAVEGGAGEVASGDVLVAVPWAYDAACDPVIWTDSSWVPAGAEAVFVLSETRFAAGNVTIDVLGWHSPYPHGDFFRFVGPSPPPDRAQWLSAREYFAMLAALPSADSETSPAEYLTQIETVFEGGDPRWSVAFPGTVILHRARGPDRHGANSRRP